MNEDDCSFIPVAVGVWLFSLLVVLTVNGLREFLVRFRRRELHEGLSSKREKLKRLFKLADDQKRFVRVFELMPVVFKLLLGSSILAGVIQISFCRKLTGDAWTIVLLVAIYLVALVLNALLIDRISRALAMRFSPLYLNVSAIFISVVEVLFRPIFVVVELLGNPLYKHSFGEWEIGEDLNVLALNKEGVKLTPVTKKIATRSLELSEISVYDILLPRNQVQIFDINDGNAANLEKARKTGHTRFPLCTDDLDHCIGIIHIKDVFRSNLPVDEIDLNNFVRPILRFDQEESLDRALQVLLRKRIHMALVEDEFGGVLGVLTLERILEEMVGEIQDEFDKEEHMIVESKKGFFRISGLAPLHEVEDRLGVENLENDEVSSFGGLITHHLGRIPQTGEFLEIGDLTVNILKTDETRVILANVTVALSPTTEE